MWSLVSILLLLAGIAALVASRAFRPEPDDTAEPPLGDPFGAVVPTPSMRAIAKYLGVVAGLFLVQVVLGIVTAHYTVEGQAFYGFPLAEYLPYSLSRTWHVQSGVFWIATAFLAAGLFLAPMIGGRRASSAQASTSCSGRCSWSS